MSITIPSSFLPPSSPQGPAVNATLPHGTSAGEGGDVPSETNLLMAAAEMHRMGRMQRGVNVNDIDHMDTPADHLRKRRGRNG